MRPKFVVVYETISQTQNFRGSGEKSYIVKSTWNCGIIILEEESGQSCVFYIFLRIMSRCHGHLRRSWACNTSDGETAYGEEVDELHDRLEVSIGTWEGPRRYSLSRHLGCTK